MSRFRADALLSAAVRLYECDLGLLEQHAVVAHLSRPGGSFEWEAGLVALDADHSPDEATRIDRRGFTPVMAASLLLLAVAWEGRERNRP